MGDMRNFVSEGSSRTVSIDPYALVSAIMGSQIERRGEVSSSSTTVDGLQADYDELVDVSSGDNDHMGPKPDQAPKNVCVGVANPYAMVEAILGRKVDKTSVEVARIMSDVLQTDYDELFDMKHHSVLYAGLQLSEDKKMAEQLSHKDMKILSENDMMTPDLSRVDKLKDLEKLGVQDIGNAKVKMCRLHNGKLRLVLHTYRLGHRLSNKEVTRALNDLITPFRHSSDGKDSKWTPPNSSWRDGYDYFFEIQGGHNDGKTRTVTVDYDIPMNNSNNQPLYCRSSDGADIWPSLYEKAFAKWMTDTESEHPDLTQMHCGDPIKAMAQINGRTPYYYECRNHAAIEMVGLVRANCVNFKTINPMCAFTYATGPQFRGSNLVANHAYSVLGYIVRGDQHYLVLRNPWGVTEPQGLTAYQGLLPRVDPDMWTPAALLDHGGLFALEVDNFKQCFQYIGVAK
ncbi:hypothetical protein MAPG_08837 [Magnaporthiopsis poae ATCC 64411]|uniref:Calpain catalytic domain-containing protein n=1 Tax=Magnaporthiopsis poae (strain ATCC 64411 / 73-15) TaxID=644358 RepID=A0A0C4E8D6_MAGP6|nr:hypothetical protein MAPG_08837 [Magnaporthiopsis poae ATCC 64411]